jgi:hypothetical protein
MRSHEAILPFGASPMNSVLPVVWSPRLSELLPADPAVYRGPSLPFGVALLILLATTARSLIHVFLPDGGAETIATIDTSVAGGANIIGLFGQWGAIQLLLAGLIGVLLLRYPGTLPLVLCVFAAEPLLRALAGHLKPIETVGTAPGHAFNFALLPIVLVALYLSLCPARTKDA